MVRGDGGLQEPRSQSPSALEDIFLQLTTSEEGRRGRLRGPTPGVPGRGRPVEREQASDPGKRVESTALRRGWNATWAVTRKELYSTSSRPGLRGGGVFLLVNGFIFYLIIASPQAKASLRLLPTTAFLLLLLIPVLTMRLLAEEKSTGTIELLMTFPITDTRWCWGKFTGHLPGLPPDAPPHLIYVGVIRVFGGNE